MRRVLFLIAALALCFAAAGCAGAEQETTAPFTVATEAPVETTEETLPGENVAETIPVLEEPVNQPHKSPKYNFDFDVTKPIEVFDCRMYPTENGTTIFAVDYKTIEGLQPIIFGYADDGNDDPNYWEEVDTLTTGEETTFVFEVEDEILDVIYHPGVFFRDQYGFDASIIEIFHREEEIRVTDGNHVGEAEQLNFAKEGKIKVHNASMQQLDNGYVRFTLECTPGKDLYICFYTDPDADGDQIVCYGGPTSGKKETITADIWAEDIAGLHNFNFSFYEPNEYPEARVYLNSPVVDFNDLSANQFMAFIGGNKKLALMYYGVIDEAVKGATLTAADGATVEVTEKILDKNGDGHSLLWFNECKAKKGDTIFITVSKEGYEDISLELNVH